MGNNKLIYIPFNKMSYFNILRRSAKVTVPPFWTDQSLFLRDGFIMGFGLEFLFLYFNAYDSFTRKATLKCLDTVRHDDYKLQEKAKLEALNRQMSEAGKAEEAVL